METKKACVVCVLKYDVLTNLKRELTICDKQVLGSSHSQDLDPKAKCQQVLLLEQVGRSAQASLSNGAMPQCISWSEGFPYKSYK